MKILKTSALCVMLCIGCISTYAQQEEPLPFSEQDYNKPKLFADLPNKFKFDLASFESLLELPEGQSVNIHLTGPYNYHGTIVSKSDPRDENVKSVVIRAINRKGAVLTFTRIKNVEGTYSFTGSIMSFKHSDAFEIEQEDGQYVLVKKHLYDLYNE